MKKNKSFLLIEVVVLIGMTIFVSTGIVVSYSVQLKQLRENYEYMVEQRQKLEDEYGKK